MPRSELQDIRETGTSYRYSSDKSDGMVSSLLKNYVAYLIDNDLSGNTRIAYRYNVSHFLEWLEVQLSDSFLPSTSPFADRAWCGQHVQAFPERKRSESLQCECSAYGNRPFLSIPWSGQKWCQPGVIEHIQE